MRVIVVFICSWLIVVVTIFVVNFFIYLLVPMSMSV